MNCSDFNQLLDMYIDNELDDMQKQALTEHADECEACREALMAAEQLRDILSHMDDDLAVPLPAQAAWRKAVRAEARNRKMKRIYTACGAFAAVLVLMLGVTTTIKSGAPDNMVPSVARIETDGMNADAAFDGEAAALSAAEIRMDPYITRVVKAEDTQQTKEYLNDIIAEYTGSIEFEAEEDGSVKVFVQVPGEYAAEFIAAVDSLSAEAETEAADVAEVNASVGFCIVICGA